MSNKPPVFPVTIREWANKYHALACEKGWWKLDDQCVSIADSRNVGELLTLAVSELSEAHECVRKPDFDAKKIWDEKGKPEGFAVELADFVIRLCDNIAALKVDIDATYKEASALYEIRGEKFAKKGGRPDNIGERLMIITGDLSSAYNFQPRYANERQLFNVYLFFAIFEAIDLAQEHGIDIEAVMQLKYEYNKTRPPRHGGLRA